LETVLYVVSLHQQTDVESRRTTVVQDNHSIQSEMVMKSTSGQIGAVSNASIERISDCKFNVDHRIGDVFTTQYVVDFTRADFQRAYSTLAKNRFGRSLLTVSIPGTRYCLIGGTPYLNDIPHGSCVDEFYVDPGPVPREQQLSKMFDAIKRLRRFCVAETSWLR
jgi:hypothetical protein